MNPVLDSVDAALRAASGRVFIAYSGGLDSTVLLHAAANLRASMLTAVHVDHGLNPRSADWRRHCEAACQHLGVSLVARAVTVPDDGNLEAAARRVRYRVFSELMDRDDDRLLMAHHRDDQVETLLLRLFQGRGLYGMPAERPLGQGRLVRPLLDLPRDSLLDYAQRAGFDWLEDPANADLRFDRNYLRHDLLPRLRHRWPGIDGALLTSTPRPLENAPATLTVADLAAAGPEAGGARLRQWLSAHGLPVPRRAALAEFVRQLCADAAGQPVLRVGSVELRRHRGRVFRVPPPPPLRDAYPLSLPGRLALPHGELSVTASEEGFRPAGPVTVRFRRGGERLRSGGRERRLKQLLQDHGVPPWARDALPLLWDRDGLLAVPGVAHRDGGTGPAFRAAWHPFRA